MKRAKRPALVATLTGATLLLAACTAGEVVRTPDEYIEDLFTLGNWEQVELAADNDVELISLEHRVVFQNGETTLDELERRRLLSFIRRTLVNSADRVSLLGPRRDFGKHDPVTDARLNFLKGELAALGIASNMPAGDLVRQNSSEQLTVVVTRAIVLTPDCGQPKPSKGRRPEFVLGCANTANLGLMVADPLDLKEGRVAGPADGEAMSLSIQRYRAGEVTPLDDAEASTTGE